ncbi:MAG: hypothetical protein WB592_03860 [Acidimicrobiales bacterium]
MNSHQVEGVPATARRSAIGSLRTYVVAGYRGNGGATRNSVSVTAGEVVTGLKLIIPIP